MITIKLKDKEGKDFRELIVTCYDLDFDGDNGHYKKVLNKVIKQIDNQIDDS